MVADPLSFQYERSSYRDPQARVFYADGSVYRGISERALGEWETLRSKAFFQQAMAAGTLVGTERVEADALPASVPSGEWAAVLQHETIPFVSYPYEWSFEMLRDAALVQLDLLRAAVADDMILKDATPYNIQWTGTRPVFIDIPSFERLTPGDPWIGYRQFCQMFLYPLLLQAYKNIPFQPWLRGSIDGIEPEQCKNLMSLRDLLRRGVFVHVYLQAKLEAAYAKKETSAGTGLRGVGFRKEWIEANLNRLSRIVRGLRWTTPRSPWTDYAGNNSYSEPDRAQKEQFVREAVRTRTRNLVWDLGSNTGTYARIAAEHARYVVAMDKDHPTVDRLYTALRSEGSRSILPLVSNLADPAPNLGWRGMERRALAERGRPDLTLCLALVHHVAIGANVPLSEFIGWLAELGSELVIEFVDRQDPMVQRLLRNKREDHADYNAGRFERCLSESFHVIRRAPLGCGTRTLLYATPRS